MSFNPKLENFLGEITALKVSSERQETLKNLADLIKSVDGLNSHVNLNFICTHNSRRSQIAELMLRLSAAYFKLNYISTFSGGTEATALNNRVVNALETAGFKINLLEEGENPVYTISFIKDGSEEPTMFSKTYDHSSNPDKIIAVMVCSDAEQNCPFIPGAEHRFSLKYEDPKHADDSPSEASVYENKLKEIGSEMYFLAKLLA